jgi:ABC-type transporter Mla MlaB component
MERTWRLDETDEGVAVRRDRLGIRAEFGERLYEAVKDAPAPLIIDLSGVTFIDSSGVHALTRRADVTAESDMVIQASRQVFTVLDVVGLTEGRWPDVLVLPPRDE